MNCGEYKIDIGCGPDKRAGYIGLDIHDYSHLYEKDEFKVVDLEAGVLPFCDNSAKTILADNVLEHIRNLVLLLNDCWRVLRPDGFFEIYVPRAGSEQSFKDPTHVRFFHEKTFQYFRGKRGENYGFKPWIIEKAHAEGGTIKAIMKPDK